MQINDTAKPAAYAPAGLSQNRNAPAAKEPSTAGEGTGFFEKADARAKKYDASLSIRDILSKYLSGKSEDKADLLDGIPIEGATDEEKQIIRSSLGKFDEKALKQIRDGGVEYQVDRNSGSAYIENTDDYSVYDQDKKKVLLRPGKDGHINKNIDNIVLHETGHALDDVRRKDAGNGGPGNVRKDSDVNGDPELQRLFYNHAARHPDGDPALIRPERDDGRKVYQNPMTMSSEYLAMGVEFYLKNDETKAQLKEKDPDLFRYVEKYVGSPPA